jgi:Outer membrane protein beta-barrel domain
MQKLLLSIFFISLCAFPALAQSSDEYNKGEFYGGYSHASVEPNTKTFNPAGTDLAPCSSEATDFLGKNFQTSFCNRRGFNGFDTSITYNFNRYFGLKGNITGHYNSEGFVDTLFGSTESIDTKKRIYNYLVGMQVKDNRKSARFKPFAHALVGAATFNFKGVNTAPDVPIDNYTLRSKVTSFAMKLGGGIDVRVNRRIDLRLVEVDYNPIFTRDYSVTGSPFGALTQKSKRMNNFTIGFGIAIH